MVERRPYKANVASSILAGPTNLTRRYIMAGRPSTKECTVCHYRHPVTEMHKTNKQVNSGQSGTGFSFNPQRSKSVRVNSGRKYYRNKTIWICNDCWPSYKSRENSWSLIKLAFIGGVIYFIFFNN